MTLNPNLTKADRLMNAVTVRCKNCGMVHTFHASEIEPGEFYCTDFPACIEAKERADMTNEQVTGEDFVGDANAVMTGEGSPENPIGAPATEAPNSDAGDVVYKDDEAPVIEHTQD